METLNYTVNDHIGYLTLNRNDRYNAVDDVMLEELHQFWEQRMHDEDTRVIILDGGKAKGFCAGLDMETLGPRVFKMTRVRAYASQARLARLLLAMRRVPQPIISCVHGAAAGLGFSFAMASDIRIVTDDARFSAAYINIGLGGADMASSYFLPRLIGSGRANEFLLTGNWMSADDAMALGFASRKTTRERLIPEAEELARTMVSKDALGIRMTKEALNINIDAGGLEAVLQMEDRNQMMILFSHRMDQGNDQA